MSSVTRKGQRFLFTLVITAAAILVAALIRSLESAKKFALEGVELNSPLTNFKIVDARQFEARGTVVTEVTAQGGDMWVSARSFKLGTLSADSYFDQRMFQIDSEYTRGKSPYEGAISATKTCPEKFLPNVKSISGNGWSGHRISSIANSRRQVGVCVDSESVYRAEIWLFTCTSSQTIFDIQIFRGMDDNPILTESQIHCL